ncbi:hypothetical protein QFX18_19160 [Saccharophagus degradans]|uniref:hypothetical protein n=1 Tax=Saccharophagus degradans TaxID=86304 RepID=UPI0024781862|nr:hypothetical protein [Saccharophagus degradans]WGO98119.1 hypothetical protein QFX18_19110 [Saccharophagus degradans]WGO98129.1 hypothetical protein QFX18_19160 [Saccharophagus degradans]
MKVLAIVLKIFGVISIFVALMAFGSDLLPVGGVHFGGSGSIGGKHQFYKIVPTDGVNSIYVGVAFLVVGACLIGVSARIKKYLVK